MDFDLIVPRQEKTGGLWQGSTPDPAGLATIPGPLVILCMEQQAPIGLVDHEHVQALMYYGIQDSPDECLPDDVLRGLASTALDWLHRGFNLYVHCGAGISRATYADCAIHQVWRNWDFTRAVGYIHTRRPVACPNSGFAEQLIRLDRGLSHG